MKYQGKERRGVAKGEENEWEREERNNFEIKAIRFFFFGSCHVTKTAQSENENFASRPLSAKNGEGRKYSSLIGQFWSRDPNP